MEMFVDPIIAILSLAAVGLIVLIGAVVVLATLLTNFTIRRK